MPVTRREFIAGVGAIAGLRMLSPLVVRAGEGLGVAQVDPGLRDINRLVVIFLAGGNDGLNTVIPRADVGSDKRFSVYQQVRPTLKYVPEQTLALDLPGDADHALGLHPSLTGLHAMYRQGRVAIVQGVDYPNHNYSHFTSTDIWHSGRPETTAASGWIGRHIDRVGIPDGALRGLGIGYELPLILKGDQRRGVEVDAIPNLRFIDGTDDFADARHAALRAFGDHPGSEPVRRFAGQQAREAVELVEAVEQIPAPPQTPSYLANSLLTARALLERDYGVEAVYVDHWSGYDTHVGQKPHHEFLLRELDQAIEAFLFGTMGGVAIDGVGALAQDIADRTLIVTTSEFGRRIGENGSGDAAAGTDHGAAGPLFMIGPRADATASTTRLAGGIHGEHPAMGTPELPADNLEKTTELRRVYQSVLQNWLADPDPAYEGPYDPLPGLFTVV